jgi:hypothetical protein
MYNLLMLKVVGDGIMLTSEGKKHLFQVGAFGLAFENFSCGVDRKTVPSWALVCRKFSKRPLSEAFLSSGLRFVLNLSGTPFSRVADSPRNDAGSSSPPPWWHLGWSAELP